ncbi:[protein-PII] uridylyltransferase [Kingella kingae]|uniref:[protein-PII] uridylyltransferase n=1 Tax=Kingella kingae TaxID=504 RepID=UPI00042A2C2F|nr:[protein-PII] uridylyltransferase [Kingella kingae]MDK4623966.1 [protein-PII] uridylyltransferase [Kingella kingae]MDK4659803.1 [protein-PII] uridylyltransferase [Kingella kingae]MDK4667603.1 [protein-PII] uridylyltransferase [Kingella kingae]MDK4686620.1 [protein-PII] uridylyltransferase [Kingella kingae]
MTHYQDQFQQQKWLAIEQYLLNRQPRLFFRTHTQAMDTFVQQIWQAQNVSSSCCLLAIGGYGRGELYPHSDVDLAIVSPEPLPDAEQEKVAQFVQQMWDAQLTPAVKTGSLHQLSAAAEQDLTANTAFLEARFLCGDAAFAQQVIAHWNAQRNVVAFIDSKLLEMQHRHDKYQGLPLEPNIKNGAGCLRDIHTMMWLARAQGLPTDFYALSRDKIITRIEAGLLRSSHRHLAQIRIELHLAAGREENRLIFDLQDTLAQNRDLCRPDKQAGIERLMRDCYRTAKTVMQLNGILIPMLRGRVSSSLPRMVHDLDAHYFQVGNKIAAKDLQLFQKQPAHLFTILQIWQSRRDLDGIAPKTLRAWWAAVRHIDDSFYANEQHRAQFLTFFKAGAGLTRIMRFLNLYGMLARYLPDWHKIVDLLQHDLFHIYPVDDHILMVLCNMRRLTMEQFSDELPFASNLMQRFTRPHLLYLAALFHDIAKGRNGDHAKLGVADALRFAADHHLPAEEGEMLAWLVQEHLLMSLTAQKQDIQDPEVVRQFAQKVQTFERLDALYLLTVADMRGTNPKIWNTWKAQLLQTLYHATRAELSGSLHYVLPDNQQDIAFHYLRQQDYAPSDIRQLFARLGDAYFARHPSNISQWQLPHLLKQPDTPTFAIRPHQAEGSLQLFVYLPDRDRLFTQLCQLFSQQNLDIVAARIFTTAHQYALNTFVVNLPEQAQESDAERIQSSLQLALSQFIAQTWLPNKTRQSQPSRRARWQPIAPHIILEAHETNPALYTLDIVAANRPYLLADLSEVMAQHGINIQYAKITTLADRAEDLFVVHAAQLSQASQRQQLQHDLQAACTKNCYNSRS